MSRQLIERFAEKIQLNERTGCWEWLACRDRKGYGLIGVKRKRHFAHRVAYELFVGQIPEGVCCLHRCDNPGCVNPDHLFLGAQSDNVHDCMIKGRIPNGEGHYRAKLCESQVSEIRRLVAGGVKQCIVASMFGTCFQNVSDICNGKRWKTNLSEESYYPKSDIAANVRAVS